MVLHGRLVAEAFRQTTRLFRRYYALEGRAFNKLYTGFPQSRTVGRGVRHGLAGGQVIGAFLTDAPDTPGNGFQAFQPKNGRSASRQAYKTRFRQTGRSRTRRCKPYKRYRS